MRIKNRVHVNGFALSLAMKHYERDQLEKRTAVGLIKLNGRESQTSVRKRTETKDNKLNSFVESVMQISKGQNWIFTLKAI